jgi:LysR family transcriptional regulator, glycine cleavage system transcriptional activator
MYRVDVPNLPPLASLRAFEAAARHLSFRAAAEELNVTQSAISHQVAELERRLGVPLFHRRSRRVALTDAGTTYQPYVRDAFDRLEQGTALITRGGATLDVQVYVTVAVRWLIPRLHQFNAAHPDTKVRLNTSTFDWEFDDTAGDVAIVCTHRPDRPGMHVTHLFDADLVAVCSPALLPVDPSTQPLLQLYTAPEEADAWRAAAGLPTSVPAGTTRFDSYLLAIEAAIEGQGIAVVPSFLVAADLRSGRLVAPFDVSIPQPRRWYLVCRTGQQQLPHVQAFGDWLQREVTAAG